MQSVIWQGDERMEHDLERNPKKVALITGGIRGIGYHLAQRLSQVGVTVIATSRQVAFQETFSLSNEGSVIQQHLDVTREDSVKKLFKWLQHSELSLDILVNNAGIGIYKPIEEITLADWELTLRTNLTGAFLCAQAAYNQMCAAKGGRILNIGSIAEKIPFSNNLAYGVSKHGLKGFSAIFAEEGKFNKVRVTHVTLGAVNTEIWNTRPEFNKADMLDPQQVAATLAHVCMLPLDIRLDSIEILPEKGVL